MEKILKFIHSLVQNIIKTKNNKCLFLQFTCEYVSVKMLFSPVTSSVILEE